MHNKVFIVSRGVSNLFYVQLISFASCIVGYLNKILDHLAHHSTGHAIRMATTICSSNLHFLRLTKTIQSVHYSSRHHPFTWINPEYFLLKCRLYMYIHTYIYIYNNIYIYNYIYIYMCVFCWFELRYQSMLTQRVAPTPQTTETRFMAQDLHKSGVISLPRCSK